MEDLLQSLQMKTFTLEVTRKEDGISIFLKALEGDAEGIEKELGAAAATAGRTTDDELEEALEETFGDDKASRKLVRQLATKHRGNKLIDLLYKSPYGRIMKLVDKTVTK